MLELKNIYKKIKERVILDDICVTFYDTGFIGIVGESGCGKSTLLYIMGMLDRDFEGQVIYNQQVVNSQTEFIQTCVSYMMQSKDYISALTVKENIVLACHCSQTTYSRSYFKKITTQLGISKLLQRYPDQLSGGQLKRVSIAKALLKQSPILLCDEPTGALHDKQAKEVMELLQTVSKERLVIIVSHDIELIKQYCDSVLTLKNGALKGKVKKSKQTKIFLQKHKAYSMFLYSLRQLIYQKGKIIFLCIFQWIVVIAFFVIVTGINGVFDAIYRSEHNAPLKNVLIIENKNGQIFKQLIEHQNIINSQYVYQLDQILVKSNQQEISAMLRFLPNQRSHIVLSQGRMPQSVQEIIISQKLYDSLNEKTRLSFNIHNQQLQMSIVGVIKGDLFSQQEIYCLDLIQEKVAYLIDDYSLSIEVKDSHSRQLYQQLQKDYFVSSDILERSDSYQSVLSLASIVAGIFIGISFLISLLLIVIVESTIYFERKHDIAYLLSLGLLKRRLFFISFVEAIILALIIGVGGWILSMLTYYIVNDVYGIEGVYGITLKLKAIFFHQYDLSVIVFLSYIFMCMIGIMAPLRKMMNTDMIDVLREE